MIFIASLPFIKDSHPAPFSLSGSSLKSANLEYTELNDNNIEFIFDEFGILHIKFINIKGQVRGNTFTKHTMHVGSGNMPYTFYSSYRAELSNITWEETFSVESTEKVDGKYDVKFKSMTESSISYDLFKLIMNNYSRGEDITTKAELEKLDFTPLKSHFKKISALILETLQNSLK